MQLVIKGETDLYRSLNRISDGLQNKFWVKVKDDLKVNLDNNIKPHYKSGKLARNVYSKVIRDGAEVGVQNNGMLVTWRGAQINYANFLEYGTRAHTIRPKKKNALRWVSGGGFAFAKEVHHPGTEATHFLENAAKQTFNNLENLFKQSLEGI